MFIELDNVDCIIDDAFLFLHLYHIVEKKRPEFKHQKVIWFLDIYTQNPKEILKEVILRVPQGTKIETSILKRLNLAIDDIGSRKPG